jgi:hypothetical protein
MSIQGFLHTMETVQMLDNLIGISDHKIVEQVQGAANSLGLLPDGASDDPTLTAAINSVFSLIPNDIANMDPDSVRIELGDRYDTLPCGVRSRIVALGMLAYARGVVLEVANRTEAVALQNLL